MSAGVIGFVGRLRAAGESDAELLRAYAAGRNADAFAALVRRHGPRVWATCRRVAGDPHRAEDAFQATFLVLARKAGGLPASHPLGGWLHAVAVNVSVRTRTAAARRTRKETAGVEVAAPTPPEPPDERALAMLDEEIDRLPAKLRDAVVLCELDGLSRREAAERLGVPEGTLSSRLAAARKRLAERLKGRGVGPELLAVPVMAVPAGLAEAASGLGAGAVPAPAVLALAGGTMRAMLLKALGVGAVACGLLAVSGRAMDEPSADPPATAAKPAPPPQFPRPPAAEKLLPPLPADPLTGKPVTPHGILVRTARRHLHLNPIDGTSDEFPGVGTHSFRSLDGRWAAALSVPRDKSGKPIQQQIVFRRTDGTGGVERADLPAESAAAPGHLTRLLWEPGGTLLVFRHGPKPTDPTTVVRLDPTTKALTPLPADTPNGFRSPDGKWVAVIVPADLGRDGIRIPTHRLSLQPVGGGTAVPVTPADRDVVGGGGFSPDSTRLLYLDRKPGGRVYPHTERACVLDLATKAVTVLTEVTLDLELGEKVGEGGIINPGQPRPVRLYSHPPGSGDADQVYRQMTAVGEQIQGIGWSPDGKWVVFDRSRVRDDIGRGMKYVRSAVVVCDADGKNSKELYATDNDWIWLLDWR